MTELYNKLIVVNAIKEKHNKFWDIKKFQTYEKDFIR